MFFILIILAVFSVLLVGDDTLSRELVKNTESESESPAPGLSYLSNFLSVSILSFFSFNFSLFPEDDVDDDAADCCPGVDGVEHLVAEDDGGSLSVLFPKGRVCMAICSDSGSPAP